MPPILPSTVPPELRFAPARSTSPLTSSVVLFLILKVAF
ncbi:hypothetical protein BAZSYMA_ACONTIG53101_0 [Bathymodiolus azoricus thioautotrophic gill symbiont]|uniref:Uncharacterized protein n=1 Tax=Bathymodiolus azoricus thioautotrophic gill symbiont TaxID=235205 RepID=A0A1H6N6F6_9GAMM|nr:hypothetical protein BAZSYMA_ACONTIG53101_0 [Bathymodiolus azoricus thioautotrophic gill symbiont]